MTTIITVADPEPGPFLGSHTYIPHYFGIKTVPIWDVHIAYGVLAGSSRTQQWLLATCEAYLIPLHMALLVPLLTSLKSQGLLACHSVLVSQ